MSSSAGFDPGRQELANSAESNASLEAWVFNPAPRQDRSRSGTLCYRNPHPASSSAPDEPVGSEPTRSDYHRRTLALYYSGQRVDARLRRARRFAAHPAGANSGNARPVPIHPGSLATGRRRRAAPLLVRGSGLARRSDVPRRPILYSALQQSRPRAARRRDTVPPPLRRHRSTRQHPAIAGVAVCSSRPRKQKLRHPAADRGRCALVRTQRSASRARTARLRAVAGGARDISRPGSRHHWRCPNTRARRPRPGKGRRHPQPERTMCCVRQPRASCRREYKQTARRIRPNGGLRATAIVPSRLERLPPSAQAPDVD